MGKASQRCSAACPETCSLKVAHSGFGQTGTHVHTHVCTHDDRRCTRRQGNAHTLLITQACGAHTYTPPHTSTPPGRLQVPQLSGVTHPSTAAQPRFGSGGGRREEGGGHGTKGSRSRGGLHLVSTPPQPQQGRSSHTKHTKHAPPLRRRCSLMSPSPRGGMLPPGHPLSL